jgi:CheY-like chemotaxis protein
MSAPQKILCIEDDPQIVELLVEVLEHEGLEAIVARDGREGIARLGERPDLVLCDINMPHSTGFDVLRGVRQSYSGLRSIPFIFITAYGSRDARLHARKLGCDYFLEKPIDFDLLLAIVRNRLLTDTA